MSHDRGCFKCGRDNWEYASCPDPECVKRETPKAVAEASKLMHDLITPVELELLLRCYYLADITWREEARKSQAVSDALHKFASDNEDALIKQIKTTGQIRLTERGQAYIKEILRTPLPQKSVSWEVKRTTFGV